MAMYKDTYRVEATRLPGWDYSSHGYYFVTICTKGHVHYFGDIVGGEMALSDVERVVYDCWAAIPEHFPFAVVDESVVMPNHVHGIVIIPLHERASQSGTFGSQSRNLGSIVRGFKVGVKKWAIERGLTFDWQPRFYEHIIQSGESLDRIRNYIVMNPQRWETDEYNMGHRPL